MTITDSELAARLGDVKAIAIVGAVDKPGRPVDRVGRWLIEAGYRVIPVHPMRGNVWGLPTFKTLADIPAPVDVVDLFRAAEFCPAHAKEFLALDPLPQFFWMQSGIFSPESRHMLADSPATVVEDRCLMVEIKRLLSPDPAGRYAKD